MHQSHQPIPAAVNSRQNLSSTISTVRGAKPFSFERAKIWTDGKTHMALFSTSQRFGQIHIIHEGKSVRVTRGFVFYVPGGVAGQVKGGGPERRGGITVAILVGSGCDWKWRRDLSWGRSLGGVM